MSDVYHGREQTAAKHFILKHYLQALAFKVLGFWDVAYVDGFSGPWRSQTEDFADSSFMIALNVLKDAQSQVLERTGVRRRVRCFFSEVDPGAFAKLESAARPFHRPDNGFEVRTYCGKFEDAVTEIQTFIGGAFPLIFVDPTGWTGYPLNKIKPLFGRPKVEVLVNFMYEFVNRFAHSDDAETIASLAPILGGLDWRDRLDPSLPRGLAVEKLFRTELQSAGRFSFVVSTKIDKATADRPHFFIAYGTKSPDGLKAFRQIEYDALRAHAKNRSLAKDRKDAQQTGQGSLFAEHEARLREASVDQLVEAQKALARKDLIDTLKDFGAFKFADVVAGLLQAYMLRETNIKDICVDLANVGVIEVTWGGGNRKPKDQDLIRLTGVT